MLAIADEPISIVKGWAELDENEIAPPNRHKASCDENVRDFMGYSKIEAIGFG
jgi:hypothetical protein